MCWAWEYKALFAGQKMCPQLKGGKEAKKGLGFRASATKLCFAILNRKQRKGQIFIGDKSVTKSLNSLKNRRNVGCVVP